MKMRSSWTTAFIYFASAVVVLLSVYPFVYAISTSLKTGTALFNTQIIPDQADLRNYAALFEGVQPFCKSLVNSVMVAVMTVGFAIAYNDAATATAVIPAIAHLVMAIDIKG